jgi:hypothetical protein
MGGGAAGGKGGSAVVIFDAPSPGVANYLELAFLDEAFAAPFMKPILGRRFGPTMLVHASDDAASLRACWTADGLEFLPLLEIDVPATSVGPGQKLRILIPAGAPPIWCNACQYSSTVEFRVPELTRHSNSAVAFAGVSVVCANHVLGATLEHFEAVYAAKPVGIEGVLRFQPGRVFVDVMSQEVARHVAPEFSSDKPGDEAEIVAVHVSVESMNTLATALSKGSVAAMRFEDRIVTERLDALATRFVFATR